MDKYFVHESSYVDDNVEIGEGTIYGISATSREAHVSGGTAHSGRT